MPGRPEPVIRDRIRAAMGITPSQVEMLSGGCVGDVYAITLAAGDRLVVKVDDRPEPGLDVEGYMLQYLGEVSSLPVPAVRFSSPQLLVMEFLPGQSRFSADAQRHAAELLAELHGISAAECGLERNTLIGSLHQPNPWTASWIEFFGQHRLVYMAREAEAAGRLPPAIRERIDSFCERLPRWLDEPENPSLLHGDVWTTNVLADGACITGFLDPAIYYGHPEIELAFTTLFGTFGRPFFDRYRELRPLRPGFFSERRDIYNLYPLLVHARLFGGSYVSSVDRTLLEFGA